MGEHRLVFDSPPGEVDTVQDFLAGVWADDRTATDTERMCFELALVELTSNVIGHARDAGAVCCSLVVEITDDHISASLSDTADPGSLTIHDRRMPDAMAESGRGLAFVERLVDQLSLDRDGTGSVWTIRTNRAARGS